MTCENLDGTRHRKRESQQPVQAELLRACNGRVGMRQCLAQTAEVVEREGEFELDAKRENAAWLRVLERGLQERGRVAVGVVVNPYRREHTATFCTQLAWLELWNDLLEHPSSTRRIPRIEVKTGCWYPSRWIGRTEVLREVEQFGRGR